MTNAEALTLLRAEHEFTDGYPNREWVDTLALAIRWGELLAEVAACGWVVRGWTDDGGWDDRVSVVVPADLWARIQAAVKP